MKNDTDFLAASNLSKFFKFSNDSDPFLIALAGKKDDNGTLEDSDKLTVPISEDMLSSIRNSQFLILQELIFYEINPFKNNKNDYTLSTGKSSASTNKRQSNYKKHNELKPINNNSINQYASKSPDIRMNLKQNLDVSPLKMNNVNSNVNVGKNYFSNKKVDNGISVKERNLKGHNFSIQQLNNEDKENILMNSKIEHTPSSIEKSLRNDNSLVILNNTKNKKQDPPKKINQSRKKFYFIS